MPTFTWVEDNSSRAATIYRLGKKATSTYRKSWKIFGTDNDVLVHADVNTTLWQLYMFWQYPNQPQNRLQAESYTLEYLGDKAWQLNVTYTKDGAEDDEQREPLKRSRSFDTGGGTQHITQALGERAYGTSPPDMLKAINVDGDTVAGVDIVIPQLQWSEQYDVPHQYITNEYIRKLSWVTGTVNDAQFRGFAPGEVLFLGASGSQQWDEQKGDGPWSLTYKFSASPNAGGSTPTIPALEIGDIADIEKKGHEYLWVRYQDAVGGDLLLKRPVAVYVDEVYRQEDFDQLGIGVA